MPATPELVLAEPDRCQLATPGQSSSAFGVELVRQASAELAGAPLYEGELAPLYTIPGWYAYRTPDEVFGDGGAINQRVLFMRSDLVQRKFGCLPEGRGPAPPLIQELEHGGG